METGMFLFTRTVVKLQSHGVAVLFRTDNLRAFFLNPARFCFILVEWTHFRGIVVAYKMVL